MSRSSRSYLSSLKLRDVAAGNGKMAQRCGRGPYHDVVSAWLIIAVIRARLLEALGQTPRSVMMLATDAVFIREPLLLDIGEGLDQWEEKVWPDLFVANQVFPVRGPERHMS
jgi:hypothetical protein